MNRLFLIIFLVSTDLCALATRFNRSSAPVAPEIEMFVKDLQNELHMESCNILVRSLSQKNAMVLSIPFSKHYIMYVNEQWFNSLSRDGRRFLIGHELMHIQHKHVTKRVLLAVLFPPLETVIFPLIPYWLKKKRVGNTFEQLLTFWYSRGCEKEADIECAKKLHCARGGIETFTSLEKTPKSVFKVSDLLSDHPTHRVRIQYLEKLEQSEDYQRSVQA